MTLREMNISFVNTDGKVIKISTTTTKIIGNIFNASLKKVFLQSFKEKK